MSNQNSDTSQIILNESFSPCDLNLAIYFLVSCLLFGIGFKLEFFSDEEDVNSNRYWLIGPLFLLSGTIVATNTLIYLRNKNLTQLMSRENDEFFPELSEPIQENNSSSYQRPPSYTFATSTINLDNPTNLDGNFRNDETFNETNNLIGSNLSFYSNYNSNYDLNNLPGLTNTNQNLNANLNAKSPNERNQFRLNFVNNPLSNKDLLPPSYNEVVK